MLLLNQYELFCEVECKVELYYDECNLKDAFRNLDYFLEDNIEFSKIHFEFFTPTL